MRVHDLRHTFASHAIIKGVTVPMVSKLLGHRKTSMTLRYTHVSDHDTEAAAERIGATLRDLLRGKVPKQTRGKPARAKLNPDATPRKRGLTPGKGRAKPKAVILTVPKPVRVKKNPQEYCGVGLKLNEAELAAVSVKAKASGLRLCQWAKVMLDNPPEQLPTVATWLNGQAGSRGGYIGFKALNSEKETYQQLAEKEGLSFSCWARAVFQGEMSIVQKEVQAEVQKNIPKKRPIKSEGFFMRLSEAEHALVTAKAKVGRQSLGVWARTKLDNPPDQLPLPNTREKGRTKFLGFRITKEQTDQYAIAAEAVGHSVTWWARLVLTSDELTTAKELAVLKARSNHVKSKMLGVRVTVAEYATIEAKAEAQGLKVGMWARNTLDNPPEHTPAIDTSRANREKSINFRASAKQFHQYETNAKAAGHSVAWWARAVLLG